MGARAARKKSGRLTLEADEMWSCAGDRRQTWWIWVALDVTTRQVVAMVAGDRSEFTAGCLWDALPDGYASEALVYSDFWAAYAAVIPEGQHIPCGKESGETNHVERIRCRVRQRCARLVRKVLSFSKCHWNHTGSLWYFIRH